MSDNNSETQTYTIDQSKYFGSSEKVFSTAKLRRHMELDSIARLRRGDGIVFSPAGSLPKAPEPINPSPTFLLKTKMNFDSV